MSHIYNCRARARPCRCRCRCRNARACWYEGLPEVDHQASRAVAAGTSVYAHSLPHGELLDVRLGHLHGSVLAEDTQRDDEPLVIEDLHHVPLKALEGAVSNHLNEVVRLEAGLYGAERRRRREPRRKSVQAFARCSGTLGSGRRRQQSHNVAAFRLFSTMHACALAYSP